MQNPFDKSAKGSSVEAPKKDAGNFARILVFNDSIDDENIGVSVSMETVSVEIPLIVSMGRSLLGKFLKRDVFGEVVVPKLVLSLISEMSKIEGATVSTNRKGAVESVVLSAKSTFDAVWSKATSMLLILLSWRARIPIHFSG